MATPSLDGLTAALVRAIARLLPSAERDEAAGDLVEQWASERRSRLWLLYQGLALAWGLRRGQTRLVLDPQQEPGGIMSGLLLDIRIGLRVLAAHRQFSLLAILLLA